uniref:Uncharacterized protein n=1 Tax=Oryza meridionalis TaxID=40149 RepID=A0A0E0FCD4_9ORYZ
MTCRSRLPQRGPLRAERERAPSAINSLEELLRKGSLALVAYRRHVTRLKCIELQEAINAAMRLEIGARRLWVKRIELQDATIEVTSVNDVITDLYLAFEAKRAQLAASQLAKRQIAVQIVAMVCALVTNHKSLACAVAVLNSLLPRLERAHEREAELEMALGRMVPSFLALNWSLMVAKQRDEYSMDAAVHAIPNVAGSWHDDVQVVLDGGDCFEKSVSVLHEYMA